MSPQQSMQVSRSHTLSSQRPIKEKCNSAYFCASGIITWALTDQERVTCAPLYAAWVFSKHSMSFTEAEVFKDCMVPVLEELVIDGIKDAKYVFLAIDESTDNTDISQLCIFVRYFNGKDFQEELLALLPLEDNTTGDIILGKLEEFFEKHGLSMDKVNLIVTDHRPWLAKTVVWWAE